MSQNRCLSNIGDIGELQQLRDFVACCCSFETPPVGLERLHSLRRINISNNNSLTVSPSVRGMSSLHSLRLSANELTASPDGLEEATSLRHLGLGENKIIAVPNLSQLTQLQVVSVYKNELTAPLEGIDRLPLLNELSMSNNPCLHLLPTLSPAQCTRIKSLWLANAARVLPVGLTDCVNLETLDVLQIEEKFFFIYITFFYYYS